MSKTLTIIKPDDWHLHLRDGDFLSRTVSDSAERFERAIVMPNLVPPVITVAMALSYRERILQHIPTGKSFTPLMTLYLTDETRVETICDIEKNSHVYACKLYPAGATTNSASGVTKLEKLYDVLAKMEALKVPLLIHGEVTHTNVDVFDREKVFIESVLAPIVERFPNLKIVLEHITTKDAVEYIKEASDNLAATITAHHLLLNRNHLLVGGIKPHYYCLPVLKRNVHQEALIQAATSGNRKFFLGTDSAPHAVDQKENACGCAGIYTAHAAIELYAEVFDEAKKLDKLEAFASIHGPKFYGLPVNTASLTLVKEIWNVEEHLSFGNTVLKPLRSQSKVFWKIK